MFAEAAKEWFEAIAVFVKRIEKLKIESPSAGNISFTYIP
jgi:hypothetical protein